MNNQTFNSNGNSEIWYWYSPDGLGLCIADARHSGGVATNFFGVICQSIYGKTCFWDQVSGYEGFPWVADSSGVGHLDLTKFPAGGTFITSTTQSMIPSSGPRWVGGSDLAGTVAAPKIICSDCHSGENAFINHPGTAVDLDPLSSFRSTPPLAGKSRNIWFPDYVYDPIVPLQDPHLQNRAWPQNPPPATFVNSPASTDVPGCLDCHSANPIGPKGGLLPSLELSYPLSGTSTSTYCNEVLGAAAILRAGNDGSCAIGGDITCPLGGMPPFSSGASDDFGVEAVNGYGANECHAPALTNLAYGQWADVSSDEIGIGREANARRGTDGWSSADWNDGTIFHTYANETSSLNPSFAGNWAYNTGILQNAFGTITGIGSLVWGIAPFGGGSTGEVFQYNFSSGVWSDIHKAMVEISAGANGTLWGINSSGVFKFHSGDSAWTNVSTSVFAHIAAGDGDYPYAIDAQGSALYHWNGSAFSQAMSRPWVSHSDYQQTDKLTRVAVGGDGDAWVLDSRGHAYHNVGGHADNVSLKFFNGWHIADPLYGIAPGQPAKLNGISVANANSVWATTSSTLGLFNYNPTTDSWQHHCQSTGCQSSTGAFVAVSVGQQDHSVWALNSQGTPFQVNEGAIANQNNPNSDDLSLVAMPVVSGKTFTQIAVAGGAGQTRGNVFVTASTGESYLMDNYPGKLPLWGASYWFVDLGAMHHVRQIRIYNRDDGYAGRLQGYRVNFYTGPQSGQGSWALASDQTNTPVNSTTLYIPINVDLVTRFVMIQKTRADYLNLSEVEVLGESATAPRY
jgi:hypothetical protein